MNKKISLAVFGTLVAVMMFCGTLWAGDEVRLRLATTTSTQDTGLLDVLNPPV